MKHIGFKHHRESKQNSDKSPYIMSIWYHNDDIAKVENEIIVKMTINLVILNISYDVQTVPIYAKQKQNTICVGHPYM
jgi:hypothetical protein